MKHTTIEIKTPGHQAMVPITRHITTELDKMGFEDGVINLFVQHTTCGLTVNENADPEVTRDLLNRLEKLAPWTDPDDRHGEGNSAAHLRSLITGTCLNIPVRGGKLQLGTWQGIFLCEFDGPRTRQVLVSVAD